MEIITATLQTLTGEVTAHRSGSKQVFLRQTDTPTSLTQVAHGSFQSSDYCELHSHATMEEVFFFLSGQGAYTVGSETIPLESGVFVRIPAGIPHRLEAHGTDPLTYVYFGVAT